MSRWPLLFLMASACTPAAADAPFRWEVDLAVVTDRCLPAASEGYAESLRYDLSYEANLVSMSLEGVEFATGAASGCALSYTSAVWGETVEGYAVRWQLTGEALYRPGGTSCGLPAGVDWQGTETFQIVGSEHPEIAVGCEVLLTADGVFVGESAS